MFDHLGIGEYISYLILLTPSPTGSLVRKDFHNNPYAKVEEIFCGQLYVEKFIQTQIYVCVVIDFSGGKALEGVLKSPFCEAQARMGKGWTSRRKASKLKP